MADAVNFGLQRGAAARVRPFSLPGPCPGGTGPAPSPACGAAGKPADGDLEPVGARALAESHRERPREIRLGHEEVHHAPPRASVRHRDRHLDRARAGRGKLREQRLHAPTVSAGSDIQPGPLIWRQCRGSGGRGKASAGYDPPGSATDISGGLPSMNDAQNSRASAGSSWTSPQEQGAPGLLPLTPASPTPTARRDPSPHARAARPAPGPMPVLPRFRCRPRARSSPSPVPAIPACRGSPA